MKDWVSVFHGWQRRGSNPTIKSRSHIYNAVNTGDTQPYQTTTSPIDYQKTNSKCVFLTLFFGLMTISFGALLIVLDPYKYILEMKLHYTPGSELFEVWHNPPIELYLKVYLFNVTNKDAFMSGKDKKLKFEQVGPYVYREGISHENPIFNDNGTITATPHHPLTWVPELSNGTEQDYLILPNIALLSVAHLISDYSFYLKIPANLFLKSMDQEPLLNMTAWEFMFGYQSPILATGNKFLPSWLDFSKLGLVDRMYNFKGDSSTTFTGEDDLRHSGLLDNYNNRPYLPQWQSPCNEIRYASDGVKFQSFIKKNDTLRFFRKSLCRSIEMVMVGEETLQGVHGYLFNFKNDSLDNGKFISENKCFCRKGKCLYSGLIDVTDCYYGFPIALSYPHFLDGDEKIFEMIEGVHPDRKLHTSEVLIEPETGTPIKLSAKTQINMALGNLKGIHKCGKFSKMIFPMLWTEIGFKQLSTFTNMRLYFYVVFSPIALTVLIYLCLIGGVSLLIVSIGVFFFMPSDLKLGVPEWKKNIFNEDFSNPNKLKEAVVIESGKSNSNTKEMEVYYCSILTQKDKADESELEKLRVDV